MNFLEFITDEFKKLINWFASDEGQKETAKAMNVVEEVTQILLPLLAPGAAIPKALIGTAILKGMSLAEKEITPELIGPQATAAFTSLANLAKQAQPVIADVVKVADEIQAQP